MRTRFHEEAVRLLTGALQEFQAAVEAAKGRQMEGKPRPLGTGEIQLVGARWFNEAQRMFNTCSKPRQYDAQALEERWKLLASLEQRVTAQKERLALSDYSTLYPIIDGVLTRAGINADREDPSFGMLCRTLMRPGSPLPGLGIRDLRTPNTMSGRLERQPPCGGGGIKGPPHPESPARRCGAASQSSRACCSDRRRNRRFRSGPSSVVPESCRCRRRMFCRHIQR